MNITDKMNQIKFLSDVAIEGDLSVQGNSVAKASHKHPDYENVQSDYEVTDVHRMSHIKGRPFGRTEHVNVSSFGYVELIYGTDGTTLVGQQYNFAQGVDMSAADAGKPFKVVYDNVTYSLTVKITPGGLNLPYLGNLAIYETCMKGQGLESIFGGATIENTGESFVIFPNAMLGILPQDTNYFHSIHIYQEPYIPEMLVDYIEEKIADIDVGGFTEQVQSDWNETNPSSPAYIKNKPTISGDGDISIPANVIEKIPFEIDCVARKELTNFKVDTRFGICIQEEPITFVPSIGETYNIEWDSNTYTCIAFDGNAVLPGAIGIGNASPFGLPGNNEPFLLIFMNGYITYASLTDQAPGNTHIARMYKTNGFVADCGVADWNQNNANGAGYIHNRPFYVSKSMETIIPEIQVTSQFSDGESIFTGAADPKWVESWMKDWKEAKLTLDGVEHTCTPIVLEDIKCIGNVSMLNGGDTGEPFVAYITSQNSGEIFVLFAEDTEATTHSIKLEIAVESIVKLDSKFLGMVPWNKISGRPFGRLSAGDILAEEDVIMSTSIQGAVMGSTTLLDNIYLADGCIYTVYLNDTPYHGVGVVNDEIGESGIEILTSAGGDQVGVILADNGVQAVVLPSAQLNQTINIKVAIAQDVTKKIDPEFLPDGIGGFSSWTEADKDEMKAYIRSYIGQTTETWTFTLEDGTVVEKEVCVL